MGYAEDYWNQEFVNHSCPAWMCTRNGDIVELNRSAQKLFGYVSSIAQLFEDQSRTVMSLLEKARSGDTVGEPIQVDSTEYYLECTVLADAVRCRLCSKEEGGARRERLYRLGALSGGLFHAIRNPLTVVQGRIELMQMMMEDEKTHRTLQVVYEQCERIASLLDTTQQVTLHNVQQTQFSLSELCRKVFPMAMSDASLQSGPVVMVYNDEARLKIAFEILVQRVAGGKNIQQVAFVEQPQATVMKVQCDLSDEDVRFFTDLERTFERKGLMEMTSSTREQHLQMLHVILTDCQVGFQLSSQGWLNFAFNRHEAASTNSKILVVDDDEILRETIVALLSLQGHHILTANTAEAAQELWDHTVDVVLLDVNLPAMSGPELLEVVHTQHPDWLKKVVLISGIGNFDKPVGVRFLQKPFTKGQLYQTIEQIVD